MKVTSVFTDKSEYSKYHSDLTVITSTVVVDTSDGSTLTVDLFRLDGYGSVATKQITLSGQTNTVSFDLTRDPYLQMVTDPTTGFKPSVAPIYLAKAGDYAIRVTDGAGNVTMSPTFAISIVPVLEIKTQWAKGVTFYDYEVLRPRVQPQVVKGVTVKEVTLDHMKGPFPLALSYNAGVPQLSWAGGTPVPVTGQAPTELLLLDQRQADYIVVDVNPAQLPVSAVTETLVIDNGRMSDWDMIRQIRNAVNWVQQEIMTKAEPMLVDTDPGTNYCDEVAIPETYYRPSNQNKWLSFKLPYANILDIEQIQGYFNQSQVSTVPRAWYVWDEKTGVCELVPSSSAMVIWSFYNGLFVMSFLVNYSSIPGFWHYRLWTGLRDLFNERNVVREAIAKKAVIELLNSAGTAYRAGYASQSTARDGVSESESYTSSAMYGTFGGHITIYQEWLKREVPRMKKRFCGIQYTTI